MTPVSAVEKIVSASAPASSKFIPEKEDFVSSNLLIRCTECAKRSWKSGSIHDPILRAARPVNLN